MTAFNPDLQRILSSLAVERVRRESEKQLSTWANFLGDVQSYLATSTNWQTALDPAMLTYSWALASEWADIFDVYIDLARFFTGSWFLDYTQLAFPPINETTSVAIAQIVLMADEEGWSFEMLARHLNQLFKVWEGEDEDLGGWWMFHPMPRGRVDTILTTLLTGVTGAGTNRIIDDMGFQF